MQQSLKHWCGNVPWKGRKFLLYARSYFCGDFQDSCTEPAADPDKCSEANIPLAWSMVVSRARSLSSSVLSHILPVIVQAGAPDLANKLKAH